MQFECPAELAVSLPTLVALPNSWISLGYLPDRVYTVGYSLPRPIEPADTGTIRRP